MDLLIKIYAVLSSAVAVGAAIQVLLSSIITLFKR